MDHPTHKISVSLPDDLIQYAEAYRKSHGLASRSEVFATAMKALRERELTEAYRALTEDYRRDPDPLLDAGVADGLEPGSEEHW